MNATTIHQIIRNAPVGSAVVVIGGKAWRAEFAADGVNAILTRSVQTPNYRRGLRNVAGGSRIIEIRRPLSAVVG